MDFISQGLPLGRWFRIQVVLHFLFFVFAAWFVLKHRDTTGAAFFIALLFGIVLLHEFGHAFACRAVGGTCDLIVLTPLGGLAFCNPPPNPWPQFVTTACGPLVNALLIPICWLGVRFIVPLVPWDSVAAHPLYFVFANGLLLNGALLAFNLLPIFPLDGGRIFHEILWFVIGYRRSLLIAGMVGTCGGLALTGLGLGLARIVIPLPHWFGDITGYPSLPLGGDMRAGEIDLMLAAIGVMATVYSWGAYRRAQEMKGWRKT